jgi:hypothetical protein
MNEKEDAREKFNQACVRGALLVDQKAIILDALDTFIEDVAAEAEERIHPDRRPQENSIIRVIATKVRSHKSQ